MARALWEGTIQQDQIFTEIYLKISSLLQEGLFTGWSDPEGIAYDTVDNIRKAAMQHNLHAFSGAKNLLQLQEMSALLLDENGSIRPFGEFSRDVLEIHKTYNIRYLRTEYNGAIATGQMASAWLSAQESKEDFPNWRYVTVGDDRVRDSHAALDGLVLSLDDPLTDVIWPPNGHGCRCNPELTDDDTSDGAEALALVDQAEVQPYFRRNVGKEKEVFPLSHPYFSQANMRNDLEAVRDYGMRRISQIMADPSKLPVRTGEAEKFQTITDATGIMVRSAGELDADIIQFADEVFSNESERVYIRYYQDAAWRARGNNNLRIESTGPASEADRRGILLHRKIS